MRLMVLIIAIVLATGCGGANKGIGKPEKPIEKMDLDAKAQKTAGDYAPGP